MHIVHCLTHSILGGGQSVPYLLIKNMLRLYPNVRHTVILPSQGIFVEKFRDLQVQTIEFPFNTINAFNFSRIKTILNSLSPDVIHTHGKGAGLYVRSISKNLIPAKRLHTHHGYHIPDTFLNRNLFIMSENYFLRNTDRVISVSKSESDAIIANNPRSKNVISIIPNIVNRNEVLNRSKSTLNEFEYLAKSLKNKFVVSMVGRNDPIKNYPLAFRAAKKVLDSTKKVTFLFIGLDKNNRSVNEFIVQYPENVFVVPPTENPLPLLSLSSILLMTSKREAGAPLVMMEAACLGIPVIGVRTRGLYDSIRVGINGLCVDNNDNAISEAILKCAEDPILLKHLSAGALQYATEFDVNSWCSEYYSIYSNQI